MATDNKRTAAIKKLHDELVGQFYDTENEYECARINLLASDPKAKMITIEPVYPPGVWTAAQKSDYRAKQRRVLRAAEDRMAALEIAILALERAAKPRKAKS